MSFTIRRKLLVLLALSLMPVALSLGFNLIELYRNHYADALADLRKGALLLAEEEEGRIETAREALAVAAIGLPREPAGCVRHLRAAFEATERRYQTFVLFDPAGNWRCDALNRNPAVNIADRRYFREALAGRGFALGDLILTRTGQGFLYPISLGLADGRGVLALGLVPGQASAPFASGEHRWALFDRAGLRIAGDGEVGARPPWWPSQPESLGEVSVVRHEGQLHAIAPVMGGVAHAALSHDLDGLARQAYDGLRPSMLGFAASLLASLGLAAAFAERVIARKTQRLARFARRFAVETPAVGTRRRSYPPDEIDELGAVVVRTARELSRRLRAVAAAEREQRTLAARDPLVPALFNRRAFQDAAERLIAAGGPGQRALILIDLDRFKAVNDALGHDAGDELLRQAADRLRSALRQTDPLYRLGGDEFAVLLGDLARVEDAHGIAEKIVTAVERPFTLAAGEVTIGASVGVAPLTGDLKASYRCADRALYAAKRHGRGRWLAGDDETRKPRSAHQAA